MTGTTTVRLWCIAVAAVVALVSSATSCRDMATMGPKPPEKVILVEKESEKPVSDPAKPSAKPSDAAKTAEPVRAEPGQAAASGKTVETMPEGCVREFFTVPSPSMKRDIRAVVVLPPEYSKKPEARYPVIYALHGMGAPYAAFADMSPLRKYLVDHPMILVCFDGDRASCYVDSPLRADSQFTTFFFDELLPYIEKNYRTDGRRAATGFSMGGYGAFHYLMAHPEKFTSASSLSGAFMLFAPPRPEAASRVNHNELMGDHEKNQAAWDRCYIPSRLKQQVADGVRLPPILIRCGTEDGLLKGNREFVDLLVAQNAEIARKMAPMLKDITDPAKLREKTEELGRKMLIDFEYTESPGGHNWPYWRDASRAVAEFHWRHFQAATK